MVFASVGASAVVLLLYVAVSLVDFKLPIETLTEFISHPAAVFSTHPRATIIGLVAFLVLAGLVAWAGAHESSITQEERFSGSKVGMQFLRPQHGKEFLCLHLKPLMSSLVCS